jgi:hypothetical protein
MRVVTLSSALVTVSSERLAWFTPADGYEDTWSEALEGESWAPIGSV